MDRLTLFKEKKQAAEAANSAVVGFINSFTDKMSFVETEKFSRSAMGDSGVVTGYATIGGVPVCIAAQNNAEHKGGFSRFAADKVLKCQQRAQQTGAVMLSVLDSSGARLEDGTAVLDGYADIMDKASEMYGTNLQIALIKGTNLGAGNYFAALNDIVIVFEDSVAATQSPLAFAQDKGFDGKSLVQNGFADFCVSTSEELSQLLAKLTDYISDGQQFEDGTLNSECPGFAEGYSAKTVQEEVLDKGSFVEFKSGYGGQLSCGLARIGGVAVGAVICDDSKDGAQIDVFDADKTAGFIRFLDNFSLPLVTFVNCGATAASNATDARLMREMSALISAASDHGCAKIAVICGNASGAGYMALASKSLGYDSVFAWATARISAVSAKAGIMAELAQVQSPDAQQRKSLAKQRFEQNSSPFNTGLCIDDVIEPQFTRQYILSALTHLL